MDYKDRFNKTKQALIKRGAVIHREDSNINFLREELEYYEKEYNINVGEDIFKFYNAFDGIELDWSLKTERVLLTGFFNIHSFGEMTENNTEGKLWVDWYEESDIKEIKKHRIFETIIGSDYYITIKFFNDGYKLYYVPEGSVNNGGSKKLQEIPLTISQYFEVINSYFGIYMIRHHLHDRNFYEKPFEVMPELKILKEIFPEFKIPKIDLR